MKNQKLIKALQINFDVVSLLFSWIFAYCFRFYGPIIVQKGIPDWLVYIKLIPFILIIWLTVFALIGIYKDHNLHRSFKQEFNPLIKACFMALIIFISVSYFYNEYYFSRLTFFIFALTHPICIFIGRSLLRKIIRIYRKTNPERKILLIGSGYQLERALKIASDFNLGSLKIIGVVGLSSDDQGLDLAKKFCVEKECPYFDLPKDWIQFFNLNPCETVYLAVEKNASNFVPKHLEDIAEQVPDIKIVPDFSYLDAYQSGMDIVDKNIVIHVHESPLNGFAHVQKRIIDILGSLAFIIVFSPVFILIAILVKLSSPGRIFYVQERMGLDGRSFPILKFRTMPENVEKESGAVWAKKDDGRTTDLGKWLRKTSLDEIPQFFNVLFGHMSLVGPRPERPVFVTQFRRSVPGYMLRHKVKAGITGWAQVQGWRGNTSIEKRIEADLYYIRNWSLGFDIKILWLTLFKGFVNKNAY